MRKRKINKQRRARIDRKKQLTQWSIDVRTRDGFKCQVCGHDQNLDAHHILQKEYYKDFQFQLINGITLCKSHHKFGKQSAHKNCIWFSDWLKTTKPEQYDWALKNL